MLSYEQHKHKDVQTQYLQKYIFGTAMFEKCEKFNSTPQEKTMKKLIFWKCTKNGSQNSTPQEFLRVWN